MELTKDHPPNTSKVGLFNPPHYYKSGFGEFSSHETDDHCSNSEKSNGVSKNFAMSSSSSLSSPSSPAGALKYGLQDEVHSMVRGKEGYCNMGHAGGSLLCFDQNENFGQSLFPRNASNQDSNSTWEENLHLNYQNQLISSKCSNTNTNMRTASGYASTNELPFGWLSAKANAITTPFSCIQDLDRHESCLTKRPYMGESTQAAKRQCKPVTKKPKSKPKDPQSVAAKNRRERISERLKILQELVPNGSKVDLVTMLEKAISYVKFLQLQVKVLATDEFWPAQGGKAPDISQVKEAIDAILASQRDRNSSSK